jgi:hypothetical protein
MARGRRIREARAAPTPETRARPTRSAVARHWPGAALATIGLVFGVRAVQVVREDEDAGSLLLAAVAQTVGAVAVAVGVLVLLARRVWPRAARVRAPRVAIVALGATLLLTVPVSFDYGDGCNAHGTTAPLGLVPALALVRPTRAAGAYDDFTTLVACPGRRWSSPAE